MWPSVDECHKIFVERHLRKPQCTQNVLWEIRLWPRPSQPRRRTCIQRGFNMLLASVLLRPFVHVISMTIIRMHRDTHVAFNSHIDFSATNCFGFGKFRRVGGREKVIVRGTKRNNSFVFVQLFINRKLASYLEWKQSPTLRHGVLPARKYSQQTTKLQFSHSLTRHTKTDIFSSLHLTEPTTVNPKALRIYLASACMSMQPNSCNETDESINVANRRIYRLLVNNVVCIFETNLNAIRSVDCRLRKWHDFATTTTLPLYSELRWHTADFVS